jgi:Secretion system C-terminal sorting domain
VQSSETLSNINIYGFDGKIFLQLKTNPSLDQEISLDTLPNGIYILEVETENQQISRTKIQILR